ncbi:retrotransposon protein, putative, ty1-copia subclass [Tanacetum coccineum]
MEGAVHTFKSHLVAKGFTQTYEVDYKETFSPVADIRAIRILIAIAVFYDYEIWQMDFKTAFLNGHLFEEVYMMQPEGFVNPKYPNHVCKLKRSIYGSLFECDFVSLDSRLNSKKSTMDHSFGFAKEVDHVRILQSCNGLLLYSGLAWPIFYYVYNPSTNLFKRIPQPNYYLRDNSCFFSSGEFRLALDPRKSSHYKVVQAGGNVQNS